MKISDERFTKLSGGNEAEQNELQERIAILSIGKSVHQVAISYNCVGVIELPDTNK